MASGQLGPFLRHLRRLAGVRPGEAQTDRQLLERFAAHRDDAPFAILVERHGRYGGEQLSRYHCGDGCDKSAGDAHLVTSLSAPEHSGAHRGTSIETQVEPSGTEGTQATLTAPLDQVRSLLDVREADARTR